MARITLLLVSLIFLTASIVNAKGVYTENCEKAHAYIFNLEFDKATVFLEREQSVNPDNILTIRLYNYIDFLKAIISEEKLHYEVFEENTKRRLSFLNHNFIDLPYNKTIQGEILLLYSILEYQNNEYLNAAWDLRKSYRLFSQNKKDYPNFIENNLGLGLMHTIIGATPERYKWIMNIAGMNGELETGINELEQVYIYATDNNIESLAEESNIIRLLAELHIRKNYTNGNAIANKLVPKSNKTIVLFAVSHYLINTGQINKAYDLMQNTNFVSDRFPFYYLYYMRGLTGFNQLNLSENTYADFNFFVNNFKGSNFIKMAYQKMAWFQFIEGDTTAYKVLIQKCLLKGTDFTDEDKQAIIEANQKELPDVNILKARVLFDGGYYLRAKQILQTIDNKELKTFKIQVEHKYRLARVLDALNEDDKANSYYLNTIESSKDESWYFAANSCYYLAAFYEEKGDLVNARNFYEKCFDMKNTEYQKSIRQKAKTGLNRIKDK